MPISPELFIGFVLATCALVAMPGPNSSLIVANCLAHGTRKGFITLAGTTTGLAVQLGLTILGATAAMAAMAAWFDRLRWLGVAYLLWLGVRQWMTRDTPDRPPPPASGHRFYWQGLFVCLGNPKTLVFFAAFLPQFVDSARPILPQMLILAATSLAIAIPGDSLYCLLAGRIRPWLMGSRFAALRHKVSGSFMIACGVGLALARRR